MFKTARKVRGISQNETSFRTGIPIKRYQAIERHDELPNPGEPALLDKTFGANGLLVMRYCGTCCPDGQYAGIHFDDSISIQSAGLQIISLLAEAERLLPELAKIICMGVIQPENRQRYGEITIKLSQLRRCIMALEVQMIREKIPRTAAEVKEIRAYLSRHKKETACTAMQTVTL